jgi:hypothetical protein
MTRLAWILAGLIPVLLAGGCAEDEERIEDARVAQLPTEARHDLAGAEQAHVIARQNTENARQAVEQADRFRSAAAMELDSAARTQQYTAPRTSAERIADQALLAAQSKLNYADALVEERRAGLGLTRMEQRLARADVRLARYRELEQNGMAEGIDYGRLENDRQRAEQAVAQARQQRAQLESRMISLQSEWQRQQERFQVAIRRPPGEPLQQLQVPLPPEEQPYRDPYQEPFRAPPEQQPPMTQQPAMPQQPAPETEQPPAQPPLP